jgi:hypothetical protein
MNALAIATEAKQVMLIKDMYTIPYDIDSRRNIFVKHYVETICPFCKERVCQYLSEGYDPMPSTIRFEPTKIIDHLRSRHFESENVVSVTKSKADLVTETIQLTVLKKIE